MEGQVLQEEVVEELLSAVEVEEKQMHQVREVQASPAGPLAEQHSTGSIACT